MNAESAMSKSFRKSLILSIAKLNQTYHSKYSKIVHTYFQCEQLCAIVIIIMTLFSAIRTFFLLPFSFDFPFFYRSVVQKPKNLTNLWILNLNNKANQHKNSQWQTCSIKDWRQSLHTHTCVYYFDCKKWPCCER